MNSPNFLSIGISAGFTSYHNSDIWVKIQTLLVGFSIDICLPPFLIAFSSTD